MAQVFYTIGIDSGTQSTKAVLMNARNGRVVADASVSYPLYEKADGTREQDPADWIAAVKRAVCSVIKAAKAAPGQVIGIGVSGQQHGFVPLDAHGKVIRRAKLWNDCSTQEQCTHLIKKLGGLKRTIAAIGNGIPPGFTASKIRWLKECEPQKYERLATILLPHNYINYWLTGVAVMEPGDASGTALYDVAKRTWSRKAVRALDDERDLTACLPPLQESHEIVGTVRKTIAAQLGVSETCIVSSGGGDNMMSAIGTGNVREGVVTASMGTSGTIFAYADSPVIDTETGEIAAFCSSTGGWLPLLCVMNCTVSTELVKRAFKLTNKQLTRSAARIAPGSDGLLLVPYFNGERTPNVPAGRGVFYGLTPMNFTPAHYCRASMEGAILGMNYGLVRLRRLGISPTQIRLTGGGAKNTLWRQICADVFNAECRVLQNEEAAAFGGALQALWAYECLGTVTSIVDITDTFVRLGRAVHVPEAGTAALYRELYKQHCYLSEQLRPVFNNTQL
jgi:D-xylulose kinase